MYNPFVSVIVLNYNGKVFLKNCFDSIKCQTYTNFEVIFADNASRDGSLDFVKQEYPEIKVLQLERNYGFAGGNNKGVEKAEGELIVLLNNDTIVDKDWLKELVFSYLDSDAGAASSFVVTKGIPDKYYKSNGSINLAGHNIMNVFEGREELIYPNGASMIFDKRIYGLPFDEDYFFYSEDVYFGLRVWFSGKRVVQSVKSKVEHFGGGTTKKEKSFLITYYQERNRLLNFLIFFSVKLQIKLLPLWIFNVFIKLAAAVFTKKYSFKGLIKAYWFIITDMSAISTKRKKLRATQKCNENVIINKMTCSVTNGETMFGKVLNYISFIYCLLLRINTIEFTHSGENKS